MEPTGDSSQGHRFPISVTIHGRTVYVLSSGDDASITGFDLASAPTGGPLYLVEPGAGKVGAWRIGDDGKLTKFG